MNEQKFFESNIVKQGMDILLQKSYEDIMKHRDIYDIYTEMQKNKDKKPLDVQVGGKHYKKFKIQPAEYILSNQLGWAEGDIITYVSRWRFKNGLEDLEKARHFLDILIDHVKNNPELYN